MVGEATDNNVVTISGRVATDLKYSHEIYGEGFYQFILEAPRLSDSSDSISVTISERLIGARELSPGALVNIEGQFRSYNSFGDSGNKLLLTVFARELSFTDDENQIRNSNKIFLNGFICKKPIYRSTPFGREITDLLIAVNRAYNKSDYIPCISWGRNARFCSSLNVGDNIKIWGRIQSRAYQKKMPDGSAVSRVAYEVSLSKLEIADAKRPGSEAALGAGAGASVGASVGADASVGASMVAEAAVAEAAANVAAPAVVAAVSNVSDPAAVTAVAAVDAMANVVDSAVVTAMANEASSAAANTASSEAAVHEAAPTGTVVPSPVTTGMAAPFATPVAAPMVAPMAAPIAAPAFEAAPKATPGGGEYQPVRPAQAEGASEAKAPQLESDFNHLPRPATQS